MPGPSYTESTYVFIALSMHPFLPKLKLPAAWKLLRSDFSFSEAIPQNPQPPGLVLDLCSTLRTLDQRLQTS